MGTNVEHTRLAHAIYFTTSLETRDRFKWCNEQDHERAGETSTHGLNQSIAERAQNDEAFAARLEKYAGQYQFMMQQAENANIGRLGTEPAAFQGINQQG